MDRRAVAAVVVVLQASLLACAADDSGVVQLPTDAKEVQRCVGWHQLGWLLGIYTFDDGATTDSIPLSRIEHRCTSVGSLA